MARRGLAWWLAGLAGMLAIALVRSWDPAASGLEVCVVRTVLDLPCPGCGLTRAVAALARGSLGDAWALHPLALLFCTEAGAGWVIWGILGRYRMRRLVEEHAGTLALANAVPLIGLWLGRAATGTLPF